VYFSRPSIVTAMTAERLSSAPITDSSRTSAPAADSFAAKAEAFAPRLTSAPLAAPAEAAATSKARASTTLNGMSGFSSRNRASSWSFARRAAT